DGAADDPEASDKPILRRGHIHGAGEPAVDPSRTAEHLVEQCLRINSQSQRVSMAAVRRCDAVTLLERAGEAHCYCLLPGVEVRRPVHLAAQEQRLDQIFEPTDQPHLSVQAELQLAVDPAHDASVRLRSFASRQNTRTRTSRATTLRT